MVNLSCHLVKVDITHVYFPTSEPHGMPTRANCEYISPNREITIVMEDFNVKVGKENNDQYRRKKIGKYSIEGRNNKRGRLLQLHITTFSWLIQGSYITLEEF